MAPKKKSTRSAEAEGAEGAPAEVQVEGAEGAPAEETKQTEAPKVDEATPMEVDAEKPKVPPTEKPKELEEDAAADSRKKLSENAVAWNMADCTLNVLPAFDGKLLTSLHDNNFGELLAGVRANTGIKAGRYMFEAKVMEANGNRDGKPNKTVLRIGLALAGSSLLSEEDCIFFDNEGQLGQNKKRTRTNHKFNKGSAVAVVVNMDAASPNADTVSVFVNGVRVCQPQKLPEAWKGKALFPIAVYKGVTLQVNFGPHAAAKLPFACRMLSDAAKADVEVVKTAADGQPEVLIPVGLPEQGVSDWADDFLAKNPSYSELSSRKMLDWGVKSGLIRKDQGSSPPAQEQAQSILKMAKAIAPFHKGNYLVLEMKSNLVAADRQKTLDKFPGFKKRAAVLMGDPSAEYKGLIQGRILDAKKKKAEAERKRKAAEAERKRAVEERQKKLEAARKAKLAANKKEGEEEPEEKAEEKAPVPEEPAAEPVTLTDEEKAIVFRKLEAPDMSAADVTKHFANFSVPASAEGFDAIDYLWQNATGSAAHLQEFVLGRKLTSRVESLKPGEWFNKAWKEWQTTVSSWKKRQGEWKNPGARKALLAKIAAAKKAALKAEVKEGEEGEAKEEVVAEPVKIDATDVDPFQVEDVMDIGSGEPLFANFAFEDWMLLSLRYELHLLAHAFKKDMDDPERPGFHESHIAFYYNKYFHKQWSTKTYGLSTLKEVTEMIKENSSINKTGLLEAVLSEDSLSKSFVHLVEEHRRDRQRRVEAGVESAELKFQKQAPQAPHTNPHAIQPGGVKRQFTPAPQQGSWQQNKTQRVVAPSGGVRPQPQQPGWKPQRITPPNWANRPQKIQPAGAFKQNFVKRW